MRRYSPAAASAALVLALAAAGCTSETTSSRPSEDILGTVGDFTLTERSGQPVSRADLDGKVWVVAFVFTCCNQACPQISSNMAQLQKDLAGNKDVVLVSISVNPESDTPETLRAYADAYGADPERWLFLTGKQDDIYRLSVESFHLAVGQNRGAQRTPGNEVMHSNKLTLVDRHGRIRHYYDGTDAGALLALRYKIAVMTSPLPMINASLNGAAGALLVLGYVLVRNRRIGLHKICMLAALGVSTVFLASYLYYHIAICRGEPTRFQGEGWARVAYLSVLLSHTALAGVAAPLALYTAYLGLRDRIGRHVSVARVTLPIWVYVSLTGVVVYWMLYHLYPSW